MLDSDLNKRRAELVERLIKVVADLPLAFPDEASINRHDSRLWDHLRREFTALLASRWQT